MSIATTYDLRRPFGAGANTYTNKSCQFTEDLLRGRGTSPNNTVAWTHYMDVAVGVDILDGVTRTAALNTLNYADGDEVRIPTGSTRRYVVVWVTKRNDGFGTTINRVYLMRN